MANTENKTEDTQKILAVVADVPMSIQAIAEAGGMKVAEARKAAATLTTDEGGRKLVEVKKDYFRLSTRKEQREGKKVDAPASDGAKKGGSKKTDAPPATDASASAADVEAERKRKADALEAERKRKADEAAATARTKAAEKYNKSLVKLAPRVTALPGAERKLGPAAPVRPEVLTDEYIAQLAAHVDTLTAFLTAAEKRVKDAAKAEKEAKAAAEKATKADEKARTKAYDAVSKLKPRVDALPEAERKSLPKTPGVKATVAEWTTHADALKTAVEAAEKRVKEAEKARKAAEREAAKGGAAKPGARVLSVVMAGNHGHRPKAPTGVGGWFGAELGDTMVFSVQDDGRVTVHIVKASGDKVDRVDMKQFAAGEKVFNSPVDNAGNVK